MPTVIELILEHVSVDKLAFVDTLSWTNLRRVMRLFEKDVEKCSVKAGEDFVQVSNKSATLSLSDYGVEFFKDERNFLQ